MPYTDTSYNVGEVIQEICRLVGHPVPVDPVGSTDEAVQQMVVCTNRALEELLTMFEWEELTVRTSLSVQRDAPGQLEKAYDLPDDFYKFCDMTQWQGTSQIPAAGPISNRAWMTYYIRTANPILTLSWQLRGKQIYFLAPPEDAATFAYMYISKAMVNVNGGADTSNKAVNNDDTFNLDDNLVLLLARAKYLEGKGFDSSGAMRDFLIAYNSRVGANKGAGAVSLNSGSGEVPLLDPMLNAPDTGYGS